MDNKFSSFALLYLSMNNVTTTNYFTTFLQTIDVTIYWFSFRLTINITFSFTNNHSPHQHVIKIFVKKFVSLVLLI